MATNVTRIAAMPATINTPILPNDNDEVVMAMLLPFLYPSRDYGVWQSGKKVLDTILAVCPLLTFAAGLK